MQSSRRNQPQPPNPPCQRLHCGNLMANPQLGNYCQEDTCQLKNCGKVTKEGGGFLCQAHGCKGACPYYALELNGYCDYHLRMKCEHGYCDQPQYIADKGSFCRQHTCYTTDCWAGRTHRGLWLSKFCVDHACKSSAVCGNEKLWHLTYCANHECATLMCPSPKIDGKQYCSRHRCQLFLSWAQAQCDGAYMSGLAGYGPFCELHTCHVQGCLERVKSSRVGYMFCTQHICPVEGCSNGRGRGAFCSDHTCVMRSLTNPGDCCNSVAIRRQRCAVHHAMHTLPEKMEKMVC